MTIQEYARRVARLWLLLAPALAALFAVLLAVGVERSWWILQVPAGIAGLGFLGLRSFAPRPVGVDVPSTPRLELKATKPARGQCPVCGLEDLDVRRLLDSPGMPFVVPYGPHEAHYECAATVPYVEPRHDPQREIVHLLDGVTMEHASYALAGTPNLCRCGECDRQRLAKNRVQATRLASPGQQTATTLADNAAAGRWVLRVEAECGLGHFTFEDGSTRSPEAVEIVDFSRFADGQLWARLAGPLRSSYPSDTALVPRELGFAGECDCELCGRQSAIPIPSGTLARSVSGWPPSDAVPCGPVVTEWSSGEHGGSFTMCRNPAHNPGDPQCTVRGPWI